MLGRDLPTTGEMEERTMFRDKFADLMYVVVCKRLQVLDCKKTAFQIKFSSVQKRTRHRDINVPSSFSPYSVSIFFL
jgi:hypothetical protein